MRKQSIGNQASLLPLLMILPWRPGEKKEKHWYFEWWSFQRLPWNLLPRVIESLDCKLTPAQGFKKFSRGRERLCLNHHPLHTKKKKTQQKQFPAWRRHPELPGGCWGGKKKKTILCFRLSKTLCSNFNIYNLNKKMKHISKRNSSFMANNQSVFLSRCQMSTFAVF